MSLDFSASDVKYQEKNRAFFARLAEASINTQIIYYTDDNEYYDILGLAGEAKIEAIPSPIFATVVGLPRENYFEEIQSFLGGWFNIVLRDREEWQETEILN